jgi:hypothetical protein
MMMMIRQTGGGPGAAMSSDFQPPQGPQGPQGSTISHFTKPSTYFGWNTPWFPKPG